MSDIPPKPSTPTSLPKKHHQKKRKYDKSKLPTPPPDPNPSEKRDSDIREKDIFEYLESILPNYSKSTSTFAPVAATEEAFDHLEKLYKLMEQMLDLREQNAKLHRKIRDLEHLNKLEKLHREIGTGTLPDADYPDLDRDTAFAETVLETILTESLKRDTKQQKPLTPTILKPSILRRNRSGSGQEKQVTLDANVIVQQEEGCEKHKNAKVSKWTRVKAAFRWEKASTSVSDSKSQDSGIHVPVNVEIARYLRVPSTSDDTGHSPADSGAAGISTPGSLSTASSAEDFHRSEIRAYEDLRCSEDERSQQSYIPHPKDDQICNRSPSKPPRNPWTKMKDIIQTRNSFKKKHRLSAVSDDIQIDIEFCSDNEDVFEDDARIRRNPSSTCSSRKNSLPLEVVERYQKAIEDEKSESKWCRVKKAFITHNSTNNESLRSRRLRNSRTLSEDAIQDPCSLEYEIHRDYKKLQKKLSLEFQEKVNEWERLKQNSPGTSSPSPSGFSEENRDSAFMKKMEEWQKIKGQQAPKTPLPSEFDLPPDFKKKLQEWEKIKKSSGNPGKRKLADVPRWKSLSGNKPETPTSLEYPQISDEFKKKLEEWKQIKASGSSQLTTDSKRLKDKTPSPKLIRKNSSPRQSKKDRESDKDSHWFDKELGKIEKEKQRLERERQKFIEREARISKLRRSVMGSSKKEVLIHTPSGFYKFEGISRKFTQKLYEWEKAQGIGPEASTFALLRSSYIPELNTRTQNSSTPSLVRSKSADSILSVLNVTSPILSQQPSSLSLNDMEDLGKECLLDSKSSSLQYLLASQEDLEDSEPQALLVEIEDYVEETAAPLQTLSEKQQLPVYQRQEFKTLCAGETIAAPKVRRSESARAQKNYNLIEDIISDLRHLAENELEIRNMSLHAVKTSECRTKLKSIHQNQKQVSTKLTDKITRLQEANSVVTSTLSREENSTQSNVTELVESVQDLSNEVKYMAETMDRSINTRTIDSFSSANSVCLQILENIKDIRSRILELRRHLSYVCAASDTTLPNKKRSLKKEKLPFIKTVSNESKSSRCDTSDNNSRRGSQKEKQHYIKSENNANNQGAVKKRIKYRQKTMMNKTIEDSDDEEIVTVQEQQKMRQLRKFTRTKTFSETDNEKTKEDTDIKMFQSLQNVVIPTETNLIPASNDNRAITESPLTVFVKTTRKLFTPIGEAHIGVDVKTSPKIESPTIVIEPHLDEDHGKREKGVETQDVSQKKVKVNQQEQVCQLPPLPGSPVPQRKVFKEISPSIRLMLAKYNQKISEQDNKSIKSGNSSGSNSPLWRSPVFERRVRCQTERYEEELNKLSPLLGLRKEVQKSASVGVLTCGKKHVTVPQRRDSIQENLLSFTPNNAISEQSENTNIKEEKLKEESISKSTRKANLTLDLSLTKPLDQSRHSPEIRQKKLLQAKEEFLNSPTPTATSGPTGTDVLTFPSRTRLSQISVESESSCDIPCAVSLMKSASAGMINVDPDTYKKIDPEFHEEGYVSLPRNSSLPKTSNKFALSNIASKFRKVKMRKGKDKDRKFNTISALCRQSLVVDISEPEDGALKGDHGASTSRCSDTKEEVSLKSKIRMSLFKK